MFRDDRSASGTAFTPPPSGASIVLGCFPSPGLVGLMYSH